MAVADGARGYELADGTHRHHARRRLGDGFDLVSATVFAAGGRSPVEVAYQLALISATNSAKPLTTTEKRKPIKRLTERRPELLDRAVARLIGVSHRTVSVHRLRTDNLPSDDSTAAPGQDTGERSKPFRWEVAARRLAKTQRHCSDHAAH